MSKKSKTKTSETAEATTAAETETIVATAADGTDVPAEARPERCQGGPSSRYHKTWRCLGASCTVGDWTSCRRTIAKRGYKLELVDDGTDT